MKKLSTLLISIIVIMLSGCSNEDFKGLFSDLDNKAYANIAEDGSYMMIDTNPDKIKGAMDHEALLEIEAIHKKLGFSESLEKKMTSTRALDGKQTDENDKYKVSWSYHPNKGLEVLYEIK